MNEDNARIIRLRESLLNNYYEKLITKKQLYSYGSSLGFSKKFKTNNSELKIAIDRVSAVAVNEETKSKAIKFSLNDNKLYLSVESQTKGSANEEIDIKIISK